MLYETKLAEIGFQDLIQIPDTTCRVHIGVKEKKSYIIKSDLPFDERSGYSNTSQVQNEIRAGEKLAGLENVACDWKKFSGGKIIAREYISGTVLDVQKVFDRRIITCLENTINQIHQRGVCQIDFLIAQNSFAKNIILTEDKKPIFIDFGIAEFEEDMDSYQFEYSRDRDFEKFYRMFINTLKE